MNNEEKFKDEVIRHNYENKKKKHPKKKLGRKKDSLFIKTLNILVSISVIVSLVSYASTIQVLWKGLLVSLVVVLFIYKVFNDFIKSNS